MLEISTATSIEGLQRPEIKTKVLVVDDVPSVTAAIERNLRNDVIVLSANNGLDARRVISEQPDIDALLLDVTMPDYDSVEMLRDLANDGHFPPIILFSGYRHDVLETVSSYASCLGFKILNMLEKPVSKSAILASLHESE